MARYRQSKVTVKDRIDRATRRQIRATPFVDVFTDIHGTVPEKMVYAELSRRNIPFLFLNDMTFSIPEIDLNKTYQSDFVIPSLKIIIEVQGAYWHSKPEALESDAFKLAVYETTGWKALAWWDFDILERLQDLFFESPELTAASNFAPTYGRSSELPVQKRTKVDTSKGIRTLNQRRFQAKIATTGRRKVRKAKGFYET